MRILFVVQRYGEEVAGGAEQHCRWIAEGLVRLGNDVHVVTSCALDYMTWANHYESGYSCLNSVGVWRFRSSRERNVAEFNVFSSEIDFQGGTTPLGIQERWLEEQGPDLEGLEAWLDENVDGFDVALVFTYLYRTTQVAIRKIAGRIPVTMHATAHDEPPIYLKAVQDPLKAVDLFLCSTDEEAHLLRDLLGPSTQTATVGVGVELPPPANLQTTVTKYGIGDSRYALILGRVDANKGVIEGIKFFRQHHFTTQTNLRLVVAGLNVLNLTSDHVVKFTGFIDPGEVSALLLGAEVLIQPSYFESFSLALHEAWLAGIPTLGNGLCAPVAGQTIRSGGGILYESLETFSTNLMLIEANPRLRQQLGKSGHQYVNTHFKSSHVLSRIADLLESCVAP